MATSSFTGVATLEATTDAARTLIRATRLSEGGRMRAMTAVIMSGQGQVGIHYVEAGVMKGGVGPEFKAATLLGAYASAASPARWYGELELGPSDELYLEVRGTSIAVIRLQVWIEREMEV